MLFRLLGVRTALIFGLVASLFVAVLSALYMTSGYAVEIYTSDQIKRIPWDVSLGQKDIVGNFEEVSQSVARSDGVARAETFGMLRMQNGRGVEVRLNGRPVAARWLAIIGTSDPTSLPAYLQPPDGRCRTSSGAVCANVGVAGGRGANSISLPVASSSHLQVIAQGSSGHGEESIGSQDGHSHEAGGGGSEWTILRPGSPELLIDLAVNGHVAQLDRAEFNKDMLRRQGSLSYLPDLAIVAVVPSAEFSRLAVMLGRTFQAAGGMHGGAAAPPYVPQVDHLVKLDRARFVQPFQLVESLDRVTPQSRQLLHLARTMTPFVEERSDLATVLGRMNEISNAVGFVTLLIAIPLLWLGWSVANMLVELLVLNERRKIGLLLVRGIPMRAIVRTVSAALLLGGVGGSLIGLAAGIAVPIGVYSLFGVARPPSAYLADGLAFFIAYLVLGALLSLLVGGKLMKRLRQLTPKQASARQLELETEPSRWSRIAAAAYLLCIVVGGFKIVSLLLLASRPSARDPVEGASSVAGAAFDGVLTLVAIPLLLLGIVGLLRLRPKWMGAALAAITRPIAGGHLSAFVAHHMVISRHRIAGVMFISALATALVVMPQVARDSFNDRIARGVEMSVGGDAQLEFDMGELARVEGTATIGEISQHLAAPVAAISRAVRAQFPGAKVTVLRQYVATGYFVPDQSGLALTVVDDPAAYLRQAPSTASLGLSKAFSAIIRDLAKDVFPVSQGLTRVRRITAGQRVAIDYDAAGNPFHVRFGETFAFLPGQPTRSVDQHQGFALAEIDYVNSIIGSDARAISSRSALDQSVVQTLPFQPSRIVFLIDDPRTAVGADGLRRLTEALPVKPDNVRWVGREVEAAGRDMFVALASENLAVFLVGGLVLALFGIIIVSIVNFISERRTFGLVRLRGARPSDMVRILLAFFISPVVAGVLIGIALGVVTGLAASQAIWNTPRIFGVAGMLPGELAISLRTILVSAAFCIALLLAALALAIAPLRYSTKSGIKEQ